jgi:hypothetical protein
MACWRTQLFAAQSNGISVFSSVNVGLVEQSEKPNKIKISWVLSLNPTDKLFDRQRLPQSQKRGLMMIKTKKIRKWIVAPDGTAIVEVVSEVRASGDRVIIEQNVTVEGNTSRSYSRSSGVSFASSYSRATSQ